MQENIELINHKKPDMSKLPGGWECNVEFDVDKLTHRLTTIKTLRDDKVGLIYTLDNFLTHHECRQLIDLMQNKQLAPVTIQGRQDFIDDRVGSHRATCWSETISAQLWKRMRHYVHDRYGRVMEDTTSTDWFQGDEHRIWKPIGVSPMLRFMKYEKNGQHYTHSDLGFIYPDNHRTLMSFVLYLTTNNSGSTRFIDDQQFHLPIWERKLDDWIRPANDEEVYLSVKPQAGNILIFDHNLPHDIQQFTDNTDRIIIRGDIIYSKV